MHIYQKFIDLSLKRLLSYYYLSTDCISQVFIIIRDFHPLIVQNYPHS